MKKLPISMALLGATALSLGACGYGAKPAPADTAKISETIKADEKKWSDEFQAKPRSLDALVAHYADDAFFIAPGVGPTKGMADIRTAYEAGLKDPNFNISFAADSVRVAESGDLAVSRGRFNETYTNPETKQVESHNGSFVTVYKKQADGGWKVVEDWAVADPAPAKPATPAKMISM